MRIVEVASLLQKINEVKAFLSTGINVMPYLEEMLRFVQETQPVLEEVNSSLVESSKKMPTAVEKLDAVTVSTETATAGILDAIERMLSQLDEADKALVAMSMKEPALTAEQFSMIESIATTIKKQDPKAAIAVKTELEQAFLKAADASEGGQIHEQLASVKTELYDVMNTLQVQDITSQQIMAANSLIESVQSRLSHLLQQFSKSEQETNLSEKLRIFDPDAKYQDVSAVQAEADDLFAAYAAENQALSGLSPLVSADDESETNADTTRKSRKK